MTWSPDLVTLVRIAADNHAENGNDCGFIGAFDRVATDVRKQLDELGVSVFHPGSLKAGLAMAVVLSRLAAPDYADIDADLLILTTALLDHLPPEAFTEPVA